MQMGAKVLKEAKLHLQYMGNSQSVVKEKEDNERCMLAFSQRGEEEGEYSNESAHRRKQSRRANRKVEEYPYNCIGMLTWESPSNGYRPEIGTAFLISPTIIVTAVHNVYDRFSSLHEKMKFYPKLHHSLHSADSVGVIRAESVKKTQEKLQPKDEYCVLLLEKEIKREKYIVMGYDYQLVENYNTEIFGYPLDLIEKENVEFQFGAKGKVARIQNGAIIYDIDTYNGQSGSPVLVETSEHEKIAVGIHCKGIKKEKLNCGCQFTKQNCEQIRGWVKMLTSKDVKTVCAGELLYEVNPLAQNQRAKQEYRYISIAPELSSNPNPEIPPLLPRPMTKVQSSLDLWQTIKSGTFNIKRYPFNCIGLIVGTFFDTKTKKHRKHYGTGFLISSKIVLTSIYNLIKFQDGCVTQYEDLLFYPKLHGEIDDPDNEVRTVKTKKYNIPNIRPTSEKQLAETSLAMLELNQPVIRKNYILIGQDYEEKDDAYLFGYGWDQLNQSLPSSITSFKQRGSEGKIIETARETITHNAYSENGSQGSPLLVEYVQGFFFIVGIHIKNKYEGGAKNCLALQITANRVKTLNKWLKELKIKDKISSYNLKESKSLIKVDEQTVFAPIQLFKYYLDQLKSSNKERSKSEVLIRLAQLNHEMGNYIASNENLIAETQLKESFSYFRQSETTQVDYFSFMGLNSLHLRDFEAATKSFRRAQSLLERQQHTVLPQSKITLYNNIAVLHAEMKEYQQAQKYFKSMLQEIKSSHAARIYMAIFLNNTSILYLSNNKTCSAKFQAEMESAFGSVPSANNLIELLALTKIAHNLSTYYLFTASYKRATEFLSAYLTTMRKLQLETHPQHILNLENITQRIIDFLRSDIVAKDVVLRVLKIMRKFSEGRGACQQMMKELVWALQPDCDTAHS